MAQVLAGSTLAIASAFFINFYDKAHHTGSVASLGQISVILGLAAFTLSLRIKSVIVVGSLVASGVIGLIPTMSSLAAAASIMFPGPVLGVISYSIILGLGIAKGERLRSHNSHLVMPR